MNSLLLLTFFISSAQAAFLDLQPVGDYGGIRVRATCRLESEPSNCAIDTGGPATLTHPSLLKAKYESRGEQRIGSVGMGMACERLLIPRMEFAGLVLESEVLSCPDFFESISPTVGMDRFEGRSFLFDFAGATLSWDAPWESATHPLRRMRHWMVIPGTIDGQGVEIGFDTGAPVTLVDQRFVNANPDLFEPSTQEPSEMLVRRHLRAYELRKPIQIGGIRLPAFTVHAGDFAAIRVDFPIVLGANHMKQLRWYFDLRKNIWGIAE